MPYRCGCFKAEASSDSIVKGVVWLTSILMSDIVGAV